MKVGPLSPDEAFPSAQVLLRMDGPFSGTTYSVPIRVLSSLPKLTLRCRFDTPLQVVIEHRYVALWRETYTYTGKDFSALIKTGRGADVRVTVVGSGLGKVELVRLRGDVD